MAAPARPQTTALATRPATAQSITKSRELAALATPHARSVISSLLKRGETFEQVLGEAWLAMQQNPQLRECTAESLLPAVARIVSWGLVIGETAHLVPFNVKIKDPKAPNGERWETRAQAIKGYQGVIQIIVNSGAARTMDAKLVYENEIKQDRFDYQEGTQPSIRHTPILIPEDRGKLVGVYAVARITAYDIKIVWMAVSEVDAIRMKSSKSWKVKYEGTGQNRREVPLTLDEIPWYAKKTALLQLGKTIPKTPKLEAALAEIDREEAEAEDEEDVVEGEFEDVTDVSHLVEEDAPESVSDVGEARSQRQAVPASATPPSSAPAPSSPLETDDPSCPKCGGLMWDNRLSKKNPKAPDYKCRSRSCDGVVWPPKDDQIGF